MQKFDTPTPITAVLDIPAGRIRLIAADRTDTTVEILPADPALSRDTKAAALTTAHYADGTLRIGTAPAGNRLLGRSGSVEVTVRLPAGSRIEATAAATDLRSTGRLGDTTVEAAQGTLELDETAAAHLTLLDGDIALGRLAGPARISTQRGDIRITHALHGNAELHTLNGDITVDTAPDTSATLDATTTLGRIHNTLRNTATTPTLTLHATTTHGNITARSL